jgi:ABC-type Fe3+-siderophore transport system permease subunit
VAVLAGLQTLRPGRVTTRALAGAALLVHALEMIWLVTPALRDRFVLRWSDASAAVAVACLAAALAGMLPALAPRAAPLRSRGTR